MLRLIVLMGGFIIGAQAMAPATVKITALKPLDATHAEMSVFRLGEEIEIGDNEGERINYFPCQAASKPLHREFSMRCIHKDGRFYESVEIRKGQKRHAVFEHVFDGALSPDGRLLAIRNAIPKPHRQFLERVRIVDISSLTSIPLPLVPCTVHILQWSQNALITSSNVRPDLDGSGNERTEVCTWNQNGTLRARMEIAGLTTGHTFRPINRMGVLPKETLGFYVLSQVAGYPYGQCVFTAANLKDGRSKELRFIPNIEHHYCTSSSIELSLQNFTLETPFFRWRTYSENKKIGAGEWRLAK